MKVEDKMKRTVYILLVALVFAFGCHKPEYVPSTADRQAITSLTAYFTSGKFVNQQMARHDVDDPMLERYVIPVPWFFPEESDDVTTIHMTKARVRAEIAPNCKIEPPLTILNLAAENQFLFTDSKGDQRTIIITGKRTKSSNAKAMTFDLTDPVFVEGFVNDETDEIYLFSKEDLSGCRAAATPNAHSTVETNLDERKNYNEPQTVTILAHDGKTRRTYTILKKDPVSIPYGFRNKSVKPLFSFEPVSRVSFPPYTKEVYPSMAYSGRKLFVSFGDGTPVVQLNALTGVREGELNTGSVNVAGIANDEVGNLILVEHAEAAADCKVYKMDSPASSPVLFHTFKNDTDVPLGYNVRIVGNLDEDAIIIITNEGVSTSATGKYTRITVRGGVVTETVVKDVVGLSLCWGMAPTNAAKVVPVSVNPEDGVMFSTYENPLTGELNCIKYINGNDKVASEFKFSMITGGTEASGNYNSNCMDVKRFNNATYMAHLITSHFPMWGCGPILSVYDIASPTSIKSGSPVLSNSIEWFQTAEAGCAAGDVIISTDGFKIYIYYFDHNCGVIGGYSADCIKL